MKLAMLLGAGTLHGYSLCSTSPQVSIIHDGGCDCPRHERSCGRNKERGKDDGTAQGRHLLRSMRQGITCCGD
jgi:hypothetical protein